MLDQIDKFIYTNKFNHIYLYGDIDNDSVLNVKLEIDQFNKSQNINGVQIKPKPIVLHINSPGGSVVSGIALMRIINKSRMPIIILIEGICASAATFVTVIAKYRVISPYAMVLIHQHQSRLEGQYENMKFDMKVDKKLMKFAKKIFTNYTHIPSNEISKMLKHDIYFTPKDCMKYGIVDKILNPISKKELNKYYYKNPEYKLPTKIINIKTNFNNVYIYNSYQEGLQYFQVALSVVLSIQYILSFNSGTNNNSNVKLLQSGIPKPILIHISDIGQFKRLFEVLPIINTILLSTVPIYSIIDGPATEATVLYSMLCHKRFIYQYAFITIDMVKIWEQTYKFEDIKENTKIYRQTVRNIFKKYTKLPKNILDNLFIKRFIFTPEECVKYSLCDEILF